MVYATLGNSNAVAWYEKMKEGGDKVDFMWRLQIGIDNGLSMKHSFLCTTN